MDDYKSADGSPTCRHASSGSQRCTNSYSAAGDRMASDASVAVSGPIYFLIREQAKSLISIEELRERMKVLEEFQERVMLAIHGIQCQLVTEEDSPVSCPPNLQLESEVTSPSDLISKLRGYSHQKQSHLCRRTTLHTLQPLPKSSFHPEHSDYFKKELSSKYQTRNSMLRKDRNNDMDAKESKEVDVLLPNNSSLSSTKCDCGKSGESIKEDSGVDSDYRDHGNDFSSQNISSDDYCKSSFDINGEDELLTLLDKIDQKGISLRQQMDALEKEQKAQNASGNTSYGQNFDLLLAEKMDLHRQLCEVKAERDILRGQLDHFQLIIDNLTTEKKKLDEKLETILSEKEQLKMRIHGLHGQFVKGSLQKSDGWPQDDGLMDKTLTREPSIERLGVKGKSLNSQENRIKVSSVLKETNVLELQRQLLTYIMENDVLHAKLHHSGKSTQWEKIAINLKSDMKEALKEKEDLQIMLDQAKLELIASQAKIRMLEKTVNALNLENGIVNFGLSGSVHLLPFQDLKSKTFGNSFDIENNSRAHSLPVNLVPQAFNLPLKSGNVTPHMHNSDSFTNIPLSNSTTLQQLNVSHHTDTSGRNSLIDIDGACNSCPSVPSLQQTFSNTPTITLQSPNENSQNTLFSSCKSHLIPSSHSSAWDYYNRRHSSCEGLKPTRGHWKNSSQNDLNSICSEFDPLNSESNSGEKFVDSLNPSSPLKGTQLSSIGDSLHSGSLEVGCTLVPWQNSPHSSANGMDTFSCAVDSRSQICQNDETFLPYSQSSHHSGKVNSQHQVNILDCLSSSNDLDLL